MLGIPGLDAWGVLHACCGLAAIAFGLPVVLLRKGTMIHRRFGLFYVTCMVMLNLTALSIYDLFGRFGVFHWLAVASLVTVAAGLLHVWLRRPRGSWLECHGHAMSWSYAGLLAAFFAEIGARLPGVGFATGVLVPTLAVTAIAAVLIHTSVPRTSGRLRMEQP